MNVRYEPSSFSSAAAASEAAGVGVKENLGGGAKLSADFSVEVEDGEAKVVYEIRKSSIIDQFSSIDADSYCSKTCIWKRK